MKKAQITRSWIVYPPNYVPGDGYFKYSFLKDARNKALSLGIGSGVRSKIRRTGRNGLVESTSFGEVCYEVS